MTLRDHLVEFYYRLAVDHEWPGDRALERTLFARSVRRVIRKHDVNLVLDVGANVGGYGIFIRRLGYRGQLVSFEPNPAALPELRARSEHDPAWSVCPYALGDAEEERTFHLTRDSRLGSFLKPRKWVVVTGETAVQVRRLDRLFPELTTETNPRVFLKLDTQGYDLAVIRGAGGILRHVVAIQAELTVRPAFYQGIAVHQETIGRLSECGYAMVAMSPVTRDPEGWLMDYDALFVRRP